MYCAFVLALARAQLECMIDSMCDFSLRWFPCLLCAQMVMYLRSRSCATSRRDSLPTLCPTAHAIARWRCVFVSFCCTFLTSFSSRCCSSFPCLHFISLSSSVCFVQGYVSAAAYDRSSNTVHFYHWSAYPQGELLWLCIAPFLGLCWAVLPRAVLSCFLLLRSLNC